MLPKEKWERVNELFQLIAEKPPAARTALLAELCDGEEDLKAEVASLLEFDADDHFIETPAIALAPDIVADITLEKTLEASRFGPYRIVREIGRGGMGAVYEAVRDDDEYQKRVALKLVKHGMDSDFVRSRFRTERQILAGLDHPNIARLLDGGTADDGRPYLIMEFVEGVPITRYCHEHKLSINTRLELFRQVCSAVHYAHQNLIIHRDLKPGNVLVTSEGTPKLLDFGIAKLLDLESSERTDATVTMMRIMTPDYASPEQIRGKQVTTATDVYSLGVLLYQLLTGQRPYAIKEQTVEEVARVICTQEPERPSQVVSAAKSNEEAATSLINPRLLRGDLDNIVLMAMRKEPERRYASVEQFSEDLRRHLEGLPVIARKDNFSYRTLKFVSRHRAGVAATAIVVLALLVGLTAAAWQARVARRQRDAARAAQVKAERLNQFLQRMLSFSNQSVTSVSPVAQRRDVTVNEMLDQISRQVEAELADQPDVRAQVLRTIGSAYASQGQYEGAERNLRGALVVQTRLYGEASADAAETMTELGVLSFRRQRFDEAGQLLEKAVAFYRRQKEATARDYSAAKLALALDYLGVVKYHQGDSKLSLALLEEALQISSSANLQGTERGVLTFNKSDLGGVLIVLGEIEKGESLLRAAESEYRQMSVRPPWELGSTLLLLGVAAMSKNQPGEAEKFLRESEDIFRQTLGADNWYLAQALDRHAAALFRKDDLKAAEQKAREALTMARKVSPDNKLGWVNPIWTLADILTKAGRASEGEDQYLEALAIWEEQPTRNYVVIAQLKIRLSQSLLAQGRLLEAENTAREALDNANRYLGEQSPVTKTASDNLTKVTQDQSQGSEGPKALRSNKRS